MNSAEEKIGKELDVSGEYHSGSESPSEPPIDPIIEKRLLRKLDMRVVPILWILYLVSFVDRGNIGNAKIQGMEKELKLKGQMYNIAVIVFNIGYVVAGVPLNIVFKKTGPKSLAAMMFCWGLTVLGQGLTKSYAGLVVCRTLEGICEAAFVPGAAYLIGSYYKKNEFLKRYVIFFSAGICAGAINGLFAALLAKMNGTAGKAGWRWIFIIEGCITIGVSFACIFFIVPWPEECKFLSPEEKEVLLRRLKEDGGAVAHDKLTFRRVLGFFKDWKIWAAIFVYIGAEENANSIVNFQPTILKGIGYTATGANVHTIPVYVVAMVFSVTCGFISERLRQRYIFAMIGFITLMIGLAVEIAQVKTGGVRYMGMYFMTAGAYLVMPLSVVWIAINVGKGYKRTVALAAIVAFGNCGAFVGSNVFITKQAPKFHTGFCTGMGFCCIGIVAATTMYIGLTIENKRRSAKRAELPEVLDEMSLEDMGEDHPDFRYSL
ncbi:MFS general substrate transporter [Lepidopterella palustris CBS 459.81]|uniref:MFS general substrate transporter n=1 Tax=Lepidopterella palustris CBS 459.81 TaxID=1314670 RepID=A0A8E2E619_9PEZI|nr:MFS general substrate transporter [Lepidopterella palustris CBS 459.81]